MKKAIKKIIMIMTIIIAIIFVWNNFSSAAQISLPSNMNQIYQGGDQELTKIGAQILWIAQTFFYTAAVILVTFAGVKYMYEAPEGKAEIKKKMIYMAIGATFLFAAGGIVTIISKLVMDNI